MAADNVTRPAADPVAPLLIKPPEPEMTPLKMIGPVPRMLLPTVSRKPPLSTAPPTVSVPMLLFAQVCAAPRASLALKVWLFWLVTVIPPDPSVSVFVPPTTKAPTSAPNVRLLALKSKSRVLVSRVLPSSTRRVLVRSLAGAAPPQLSAVDHLLSPPPPFQV